jgi:hypothetical protein
VIDTQAINIQQEIVKSGQHICPRDTCAQYLRYYETARFGTWKTRFTEDTWNEFQPILHQISAEITGSA